MGILHRSVISPLIRQALGRLQLPCRKALTGLALTAGVTAGLVGMAPNAQALEAVQLSYGELESEPIPLADLEEFAFSGIPSEDIQLVLDILRIDEELAQDLLTREIPIDFQSIRETSDTLIGGIFWRVVGSAISLTDTTGQAWEYLQTALLDAAADDRITMLEVLQNLDVGLMIIDTQRLLELSSLVNWEREPVMVLNTSVKLIVEVVITNWETDYARKVEEYALFGIPEYWIVDYRGLGSRAFIGSPKQPTLTVCRLV